jgi:diguanylate cyclase (GGDEF)-like protein
MMCLSKENPLLSVFPMSLNDGLTHLYNREGFICAGEYLVESGAQSEGWACLLSLQVNHWEFIGQALGRESADRLLTRTGECLREAFRRSSVIGRISANKFAVFTLLPFLADGTRSLERLNEIIKRHNLRLGEIDLSVSGGFYQFQARPSILLGYLLDEADARLQATLAERRSRNARRKQFSAGSARRSPSARDSLC